MNLMPILLGLRLGAKKEQKRNAAAQKKGAAARGIWMMWSLITA
jgi:hypothetical protein